jgi:DNA-binding NtrC family response regulator
MEKRKLLVLNGTSDTFLKKLHAVIKNWHCINVKDARRADLMLRLEKPLVGLVHFDSLPSSGELAAIDRLFSGYPATEWLALVEPELLSNNHIRRLVSKHCYDYHTCPYDMDRLQSSLGHCFGLATMARPYIKPLAEDDRSGFVACSPAMKRLMSQVKKIASYDASVLIGGESGSGKEKVAKAIHQYSGRNKGPFVAINCGAIPANLIQSEFFGHERGAYTGAHKRQIGRIEVSHGGTLFLDEIGDLPLDLQVNLLRFLQEKSFERLGGTDLITVDTRVICATHKDLKEAVKNGLFREDLYYRLNVVSLTVPPLRERTDDIEPLAVNYLQSFMKQRNRKLKGFSPEALFQLKRYSWPGNVRELINAVHRAVVMADSKWIEASDLELPMMEFAPQTATLKEVRSKAELKAIEVALLHSGNNVSMAARQLGVSRVTLYRLMDKHNYQ